MRFISPKFTKSPFLTTLTHHPFPVRISHISGEE